MNFLKLKTVNAKQWRAVACALVLDTELTVCCFIIGPDNAAHWINISIAALGTAVGWAIGTLISPWSKDEQNDFAIYAKAVSAFASGYLVGKIDPIVTYIFSTDYVKTEPTGAFRLILWLATAIVAAMFAFPLFAPLLD